MNLKLKICDTIIDPKTKKPKGIICHTIDTNIPDLRVNPRNSLPAKQVIPPALQAAQKKGLSSDTEKDIHTLARIASQVSSIHHPRLQREFVAFLRNTIKHFDLPEGTSLSVEEE